MNDNMYTLTIIRKENYSYRWCHDFSTPSNFTNTVDQTAVPALKTKAPDFICNLQKLAKWFQVNKISKSLMKALTDADF